MLAIVASLYRHPEGLPPPQAPLVISSTFLQERESTLETFDQATENTRSQEVSPRPFQRAEKVLESAGALREFIQKLEAAYAQKFHTQPVQDLIESLSSVAAELGPDDGVKLFFAGASLDSYEIMYNAGAASTPRGFSPDTAYLLVTTFLTDKPSSGTVWVVPTQNPSEMYELIRGLDQPTGICFDVEHNYLYVADANRLYQYSIYWGDSLLLTSTAYSVIYEGVSPSDCRVDSHGNLLFTVAEANQLNMVGYLDLLFGFKNKHYTLYEGSDEIPLKHPTALEMTNANSIYVLNGGPESLLEVSAHAEYTNGGFVQTLAYGEGDEGLALVDDGTRFFIQNGTLWMQEVLQSPQRVSEFALEDPKKMWFANGKVYITDYSQGVYALDLTERTKPSLVVSLPTSYGLCYVEDSALHLAGLALVLLSVLFN